MAQLPLITGRKCTVAKRIRSIMDRIKTLGKVAGPIAFDHDIGIMHTETRAAAFIEGIATDSRVCILYHADADGICAGTQLFLLMKERGHASARALPLGRGENPFSPATRQQLSAMRPDDLIVVDSGSRQGKFPEPVRTLIIDHHVPDGIPEADIFFNTFLDETGRVASEAVFDLVNRVRPESSREWMAIVGAAGDRGIGRIPARFSQGINYYGKKNLQETLSLVNAARRHESWRVGETFDLLVTAYSPVQFNQAARKAGFRQLQAEVSAEVKRHLKHPPRFHDRFALVELSSPHQVHPLIATIWAGKLQKHVVIAANHGFLPGRVNFSMRTRVKTDLLELLKACRADAREIGFGHKQATGGIVDMAEFNSLLKRLGFDESTVGPSAEPDSGKKG